MAWPFPTERPFFILAYRQAGVHIFLTPRIIAVKLIGWLFERCGWWDGSPIAHGINEGIGATSPLPRDTTYISIFSPDNIFPFRPHRSESQSDCGSCIRPLSSEATRTTTCGEECSSRRLKGNRIARRACRVIRVLLARPSRHPKAPKTPRGQGECCNTRDGVSAYTSCRHRFTYRNFLFGEFCGTSTSPY